jgi:ABC-type methionine transport system ATPase subunit
MGALDVTAQPADTSTEALAFEGVSFVAGSGEPIVRKVTWRLELGAVASVIGPSGSGKTSLLRLVNRLDDPTSGAVSVLGCATVSWAPRELRKRVGWVPQQAMLCAGTASHNVELPRELGAVEESGWRERRDAAIDVAGLDRELLDRGVTKLSAGQRQRVAIARAVAMKPQILALDEPTSSIDGAGATALLERLLRWREDTGATLVVVTHRIADVRVLGGEVLMLDAGAVVDAGAAAELLEGDRGARVRGLLSGDAA